MININVGTVLPVIRIFSYLIGAVFAGYMIMDLRPALLRKFTTLPYQFLISLVLSAGLYDFTFHDWDQSIASVLFMSITFTAFIRYLYWCCYNPALDQEKIKQEIDEDPGLVRKQIMSA